MSRVQARSRKVTAAIGTIGNTEGLNLTLQSVLFQELRPNKIVIYNCSEGLSGTSFYLNQLLQIAVQFGIESEVKTLPKIPIDAMYQRMLDDCEDYLWMINDDVVLHPSCLFELQMGFKSHQDLTVAVGMKPDITNGRGYKNWSRVEKDPTKGLITPHSFYEVTDKGGHSVKRIQVDCGNSLIAAWKVKAAKVSFIVDKDDDRYTQVEDWVFSARLQKAKLKAVVISDAQAIHLDKPTGGPFSFYDFQRQVIIEKLRKEGLPMDVIKEWGAS